MHENYEIASSSQRVLIYPAQVSRISGRQIYFLFSIRQVEDILMDAPVLRVPFSPSYVDGVAEWRNCIVPVVYLETFWGPKHSTSRKNQRLMVVRALQSNGPSSGADRVMLRITPPVRMLTLPIECTPVFCSSISDIIYTKGVYDWENGILVVADIERILGRSNIIHHECNRAT